MLNTVCDRKYSPLQSTPQDNAKILSISLFQIQMYLFKVMTNHINKHLHVNMHVYSHWLISIYTPLAGWWVVNT